MSNNYGIHLYVMQSTSGMVKIGRSNNPRDRLKQCQTGSGERIALLKVLPDRGYEELSAHQACIKFWKGGEWFKDSADFRVALCAYLGVPIIFRNGKSERDDVDRRRVKRAVAKVVAEIEAKAEVWHAKKAEKRAASICP